MHRHCIYGASGIQHLFARIWSMVDNISCNSSWAHVKHFRTVDIDGNTIIINNHKRVSETMWRTLSKVQPSKVSTNKHELVTYLWILRIWIKGLFLFQLFNSYYLLNITAAKLMEWIGVGDIKTGHPSSVNKSINLNQSDNHLSQYIHIFIFLSDP